LNDLQLKWKQTRETVRILEQRIYVAVGHGINVLKDSAQHRRLDELNLTRR